MPRLLLSVESSPVVLKCDFCCVEDPPWSYPAEDFVDTPISRSVGGWAACETCHKLIEAGCREGLATRSVQRFLAEHGPVPDVGKLLLIISETHGQFFQHRTGPVERVRRSEG